MGSFPNGGSLATNTEGLLDATREFAATDKMDRTWWIAEQGMEAGSYVRTKYVFADGTSSIVRWRPGTFTADNITATGNHLAENPDLRQRR